MLLLLPTTSYRTPDFLAAASMLGLDVTVASEEASTMEGLNPEGLLTLDFANLAACADRVALFSSRTPMAAVVGVDERTAVVAAAVAERLGLPHNSVAAVTAAGNKAEMRSRLAEAGVASPRYRLFRLDADSRVAAREVGYPCVLKPTFLSASRGVIRADDASQFEAAWGRIARLLGEPAVTRRGGDAAGEILVEDFVAGAEVALEGLLTGGELRVLALFDKAGDAQQQSVLPLRDFRTELMVGKFQILEPRPEAVRVVNADQIEALLVPGLAFDETQERIRRSA